MAIGVGAPKKLRQSRESESCIRDYPDAQCPDLREVRVGWNEEEKAEKTGSDDFGRWKKNTNYLCGPVTTL
jgi:hypothetical protein